MACSDPAQRFYRPRRPRESALFRLLDEHFDEFERVYPERYQPRYGVLRSAIRPAVTGFLKCGDLHHGFARVRCPDCHHEMFVAFSPRTVPVTELSPEADPAHGHARGPGRL
jgi:hypothetical protein